MAMTIKDMRDQVRSIIDIDSSDVSNDVLNRMLGQGFDYIVFSEKRWPFYEVATTFTTTIRWVLWVLRCHKVYERLCRSAPMIIFWVTSAETTLILNTL